MTNLRTTLGEIAEEVAVQARAMLPTMTKRDLFAAMAMQGMMSRRQTRTKAALKKGETILQAIAADSRRMADALNDELEKQDD